MSSIQRGRFRVPFVVAALTVMMLLISPICAKADDLDGVLSVDLSNPSPQETMVVLDDGTEATVGVIPVGGLR